MAKRKKKKHIPKLLIFLLVCVLGFFAYTNLFEDNIVDIAVKKFNAYSKIEGYNKELYDRYKAYDNLYPEIDAETIVKAVNLNIDTYELEYDSNIDAFTLEKYFIKDNILRYLDYQNNNQELTHHEIIRRVNSNLDKEFYVDYVDTDFSKGLLIIANKFNYLGDYVPDDLVIIPDEYAGNNLRAKQIVVDAYIEMYKALEEELNLKLKVNSAYRSYETQKNLYNYYINLNGQTWADQWSAKPGFSEHQTDLALDITTSSTNFDNFEDTKAYSWLVANCYKYGFILRCPSDDYYLTGYNFESWHFRYVGVDVATQINNEQITFEEYYEYYVK